MSVTSSPSSSGINFGAGLSSSSLGFQRFFFGGGILTYVIVGVIGVPVWIFLLAIVGALVWFLRKGR